MLKKQYLKSRNACKVTFYTSPELQAEKVVLVEEFNQWSPDAMPMKPLKDGRFKAMIELPPYKTYQFRYLADDSAWHNDWAADQYVPNPFCGDNSVVEV